MVCCNAGNGGGDESNHEWAIIIPRWRRCKEEWDEEEDEDEEEKYEHDDEYVLQGSARNLQPGLVVEYLHRAAVSINNKERVWSWCPWKPNNGNDAAAAAEEEEGGGGEEASSSLEELKAENGTDQSAQISCPSAPKRETPKEAKEEDGYYHRVYSFILPPSSETWSHRSPN